MNVTNPRYNVTRLTILIGARLYEISDNAMAVNKHTRVTRSLEVTATRARHMAGSNSMAKCDRLDCGETNRIKQNAMLDSHAYG